MQKAISHDQAVVDQDDNIIYADNEKEAIDLDELNKSRMQELKELFTKEAYDKVEKSKKGYGDKIQSVIDSDPPQYSNVQASIDYVRKVLG